MSPLELVNLPLLMARTQGRPEIVIGLLDGPIIKGHPHLSAAHLREMPGAAWACTQTASLACQHGTFVAGILAADRQSTAPAICPGCTLLVRPIFPETAAGQIAMTRTTPAELAHALYDCISVGARILNLSLALAHPSSNGLHDLEEALTVASQRGVIVVAAAGNQGLVASSPITRHPWVIPVVACDGRGAPLVQSNLAASISRRGLCAPGDNVASLGADGQAFSAGGTSVAAPFVTGAIALLWSEFPNATASQVRLAILQAAPRGATVIPPLLNAWGAYQYLHTTLRR